MHAHTMQRRAGCADAHRCNPPYRLSTSLFIHQVLQQFTWGVICIPLHCTSVKSVEAVSFRIFMCRRRNAAPWRRSIYLLIYLRTLITCWYLIWYVSVCVCMLKKGMSKNRNHVIFVSLRHVTPNLQSEVEEHLFASAFFSLRWNLPMQLGFAEHLHTH